MGEKIWKVAEKLEERDEYKSWISIEIHDPSKSIESIDLNIENLEELKVEYERTDFTPDFEDSILTVEFYNKSKAISVKVFFWNDAAEKLMACLKKILSERDSEDTKVAISPHFH